jgi:hypothetical protein
LRNFSQLQTVKKDSENGAAVTSLRMFVCSSGFTRLLITLTPRISLEV